MTVVSMVHGCGSCASWIFGAGIEALLAVTKVP